MGKDSGGAPTPPDPNVVGNAATKTNQNTALYNTTLNRYGVNSPLGSTSWSSTPGTPTYDDAAYQKAVASYNATPATIAGPANPNMGPNEHATGGYGFGGGSIPNPRRGTMPATTAIRPPMNR